MRHKEHILRGVQKKNNRSILPPQKKGTRNSGYISDILKNPNKTSEASQTKLYRVQKQPLNSN